jgi:hypothetical protein
MLLTTLLFAFKYGSYTIGLKDLSVILLVYSCFLLSPNFAVTQGRDLLYHLREMLFSLVILVGFYWRPSQVFVKLNRDLLKKISLYSFIVLGIIALLLIWQSSKLPPFNDSFFIEVNKTWLVQNQGTLATIFGPDSGQKRYELARGLRPSIFFAEPSYLTVAVSALYTLSSAYAFPKPRLSKIAFIFVLLSAILSTSVTLFLFSLCCLLIRFKNFPNVYETITIIFTLTLAMVFFSPDLINVLLLKIDPVLSRVMNFIPDNDPSRIGRVGGAMNYFYDNLTSLWFGFTRQQLLVLIDTSQLDNGIFRGLLSYGIAFLFYMCIFIYSLKKLKFNEIPSFLVLVSILFIASSNGAFFAIDKAVVIFYTLICLRLFISVRENSETIKLELVESPKA